MIGPMGTFLRFVAPVLFVACSASSPATTTADAAASCTVDGALPGVAYDVSKSRFSFGGTPVKTVTSSITHYTGPQGELGIFSNGEALASLDATAIDGTIAPLSGTAAMLQAYSQQYFGTMGLPSCQVASEAGVTSSVSASGDDASETVTPGATSVILRRTLGTIPVVESLALADFDVDYATTSEDFYWPKIPASVVETATSLQAKLATPQGLAAYKAKLPSDAQGTGHVAIHHSGGSESAGFVAIATYDLDALPPSAPQDEDPPSFDANGKLVELP
jgi:hypothetical protein